MCNEIAGNFIEDIYGCVLRVAGGYANYEDLPSESPYKDWGKGSQRLKEIAGDKNDGRDISG